jgi:leucyl-tRNA synthetase
LTVDATVEVPVQISGKVRGKIAVAAGASAEELENVARADERIGQLIAGKQIVKIVAVPGRLINFVVR